MLVLLLHCVVWDGDNTPQLHDLRVLMAKKILKPKSVQSGRAISTVVAYWDVGVQ